MLQEVGLCVANICNANCIFCPRNEVKATGVLFMTPDLVDKIVREIESKKFKEVHNVVHFNIGENGEPTLNPHLPYILRSVRKLGAAVSMYTNFSNLTEDLAETIIKEGLIDNLHTNIDGIGPFYFDVKSLFYSTMEYNLKNFLKIKKGYNSPIKVYVHVVSAERYNKAVRKHFKSDAGKLRSNNFGDKEAEKVKAEWESLVDGLGIEGGLMWAERFYKPFLPGDYSCPLIGRVETNAFINPDGDWYACCFDPGNENKLGNVKSQSLAEIFESEKRLKMIEYLKTKQFEKIGGPCARVDCCQIITSY